MVANLVKVVAALELAVSGIVGADKACPSASPRAHNNHREASRRFVSDGRWKSTARELCVLPALERNAKQSLRQIPTLRRDKKLEKMPRSAVRHHGAASGSDTEAARFYCREAEKWLLGAKQR
jgi:hypothetical protein